MKCIVTGGAGFIGSAVVRQGIKDKGYKILNLDKLTYAGNLESVAACEDSDQYQFSRTDICDGESLKKIFNEFKPDAMIHLAAESHVDRSIDGPKVFLETNFMGTYQLLEAARSYVADQNKPDFRFLHVSTDEVFGSLGDSGFFTETTPYSPNSPYSASKAASDHLVRAWHHTFGLKCITTNCSNNYGPYQFPEKLIPLMIFNALEERPLPVYGDGSNIRDWLYVEDHAAAIWLALEKGNLGETYNIGGHNEKTNLDVVHTICDRLDAIKPSSQLGSRRELISFVKDRPGHDQRYAIDAAKIQKELGWTPSETFESGIEKTIDWYLGNMDGWCSNVKDGSYRERIGKLS